MSYEVEANVEPIMLELKRGRKHRWVMFGITKTEPKTHQVVDVCSDKGKTVHDLVAELPESECRYIAFDYEYTTDDGRKTDKLFFITWCPRIAHQGLKMEYATARTAIRQIVDCQFDINAATSDDILLAITGKGVESDEEEDNDDWMDE